MVFDFSDSIPLHELYNASNLEVIDLSYCDLEILPHGIENLKNLKHLYFWGNKISKVEIEKLRRALPGSKITSVHPYKKI
ncbi:leucine-rich repeat domain-containing protein [Chryseobacterium carnipullorum]|uniref:Leucine-rich repeat domain-containing protein n=1 Tax=Chryseobacterium carnipullorum TaxID=1124835 RepID=A0A3G6M768_CHRCU|nr:leucine-rich repeat domain-containing protein [Chryseobacterium carnipullorum]AZA64830.1 leucine-rich repeat domain-containing protein [Chryseobacterium carnipullorum]